MENRAPRFETVLSGGNTSDVYAIGADAVVKVPRPGVPDHWIEIEALHAAAVHDAGLPTPKVLDMLDVGGRASIVFERVHGTSMLEQLASSPDRAESLARDMAAIQREVHSAPAPEALRDLHDRVAGKIATAGSVSDTDRAAAEQMLRELPSGNSVCHGDFHPGNILLGDQGPMIIDWFDASSGPPVADIVRSSIIVRPPLLTASPPPHLANVTVDALDRFHRTYVACMFDELDITTTVALSWEAVLAVSRLAEPLGPEIEELVSVWASRADLCLEPVTALAEALLPASSSED